MGRFSSRGRVGRSRPWSSVAAEALERRTLFAVGSLHLISNTDVNIPDDGVAGAGIATSSIDAGAAPDAAPDGAVVTSVTVHYIISHPFISDLVVRLSAPGDGGAPLDELLWNREGGSGDDINETQAAMNRWNGLSPGRVWTLSADDVAVSDVGFIDLWEITIHWATLDSGSIGGVVWHDLDADGARDEGEPPLPGWTVYLDNDDDRLLDDGEPSVVSDTLGEYSFFDVPAGTYSVRQEVPPGWEQTVPGEGAAPTWTSAGPTRIVNGQVEGMFSQANPVSGAVHAVAPHPTDPNVLYVGAVNGGVWKTTNATAAEPTWQPLTDDLGSLSVGAIDIDPTDPTGNTLVFGAGRFSSLGNDGSQRAGAWRTTDGGATWTPLSSGLAGKNISGVAARGSTVVLSVNFAEEFTYNNIGIWRSTNGGATFAHVSGDGPSLLPNGLPGGRAFDLAGDPADPAVLYAAVRDAGSLNGIYKSTNTGATWSRVSNAAMNSLNTDTGANNTSNIEIAAGNAGQVYVGIMGSNGRLSGLFRSGNGGGTWTALDTPVTNENGTLVGIQPRAKEYDIAGGQGQIHFSILADPIDPNVVYIGGDRQPGPGEGPTSWPNSIGATNYTGRLFRVDASRAPGTQATALTHNPSTLSNSAPHADSRDMAFDADGNIVQGDDGGVYRRTNPRAFGDWTSLNGNLQITEIHSLDYDHNTNQIMAGTQDVGEIRTGPSGTVWDTVAQGDGGVTQIDDSNPGFSYHYFSYVGLQNFYRATVDSSGDFTAFTPVGLQVSGAGTNLIAYDTTRPFYTPYVLNTVAPERMAIGTTRVYVSANRGDTLTDLGSLGATVGALAYGGRRLGVVNPDVIYVGAGHDVFFRNGTAGPLANRHSYPGGVVRDLVLDPDDWQTAYVADATNVYRTTDAGVTWTAVTGSLADPNLRTIEFVTAGPDSRLVVGGASGVFGCEVGDFANWTELAPNLPGAPVMDLRYDAADDVLVAGTLGRGAWTVQDVTGAISGAADGAYVVVLAGQHVADRNFGNFRDNLEPVAAADSYSVDEDATLAPAAPGVLANDTDADGDTLTARLGTSPSHGTLTLNLDGSFTYTSASNYNGADSFTYFPTDGTADGEPVTVSITINPVNDAPIASVGPTSSGVGGAVTPGWAHYWFRVTYSDDGAVTKSTVGSGDVQVTGPGGYSQLGTLSNIVAAGTGWAATYRVPAPGGAWDASDNGTYTISMRADQVADDTGLFVPAGTLGSVVAAVPDTAAPTATLAASDITTPGTHHWFQVTYADDGAVNGATIGSGDVLVTGPGGYSQPGTLSNRVFSAGNYVVTYRVPAPGGRWDAADNGTYTVSMRAGEVSDTTGTFVPAGPLGSFAVSFADATPPTATLAASDVTTAGGANHSFTVSYADNVAIAFGVIDGQDVRVTGPGGYSQLGVLSNLTTSGTTRIATYRVPAPGGGWDAADNGTYTVSLNANQVSDTSGNFAAAGVLGTFQVNVPAPTTGVAFPGPFSEVVIDPRRRWPSPLEASDIGNVLS